MRYWSNQASAGDCAVTSCLQVERLRRAAPNRHRWAASRSGYLRLAISIRRVGE
jgi:hypothetical protein